MHANMRNTKLIQIILFIESLRFLLFYYGDF